MALVKFSGKTDTKSNGDTTGILSTNKKNILTEDEYTEKMEDIITRDFFPDLPKLQAQNNYLDAIESGDVAKVQQIQAMYPLSESTRSRVCSIREPSCTPSACDTPLHCSSPLRSTNLETDDVKSELGKKNETLDHFLSKTTSEDNASFLAVMEKSQQQHEQKYPWLYKDEKAESYVLTLPSTQSHEAIEDSKKELATWAYKNKNALMYVPDGVEQTLEEKLSSAQDCKEILHSNTRFEAPPFDEEANKEAIAEAASLQAKMLEGRVGIDGKELQPSESPKVNGFGFVATPLPQPGISETPIMTWGEIEGTPFRLDGGDTPLPQTPSSQQFRIPNLSARERIALSLADKAAKKHRKKKNTDLQSPLRKFGSSTPLTPLERLQDMSPAARNLAYTKLGLQKGSDRALRASYSPSPLRTSDRRNTPLQTPVATPDRRSTPLQTHAARLTPKPPTPISIPLNEKILSAPKRHKASDFF